MKNYNKIISFCKWAGDGEYGFFRTYDYPYKYIVADLQNINMKIMFFNTTECANKVIELVGPYA